MRSAHFAVLKGFFTVALVAGPVVAQQSAKLDTIVIGPTGMGSSPLSPMVEGSMIRETGPEMMELMSYTPAFLLAFKDTLGLSADQIARLTRLRDGSKRAHDVAMAEARAHIKELEQAANAPRMDSNALRVHAEAAHRALGKAYWATLATAPRARALLTDAQRAKNAKEAAANHWHVYCRKDRFAVVCICGMCEGDHHEGEKCTWELC